MKPVLFHPGANLRFVVQVNILAQTMKGNRSIHGAGIDIDKAKFLGYQFGDSTLSGTNRAVNRDLHEVNFTTYFFDFLAGVGGSAIFIKPQTTNNTGQ